MLYNNNQENKNVRIYKDDTFNILREIRRTLSPKYKRMVSLDMDFHLIHGRLHFAHREKRADEIKSLNSRWENIKMFNIGSYSSCMTYFEGTIRKFKRLGLEKSNKELETKFFEILHEDFKTYLVNYKMNNLSSIFSLSRASKHFDIVTTKIQETKKNKLHPKRIKTAQEKEAEERHSKS